MIDTVQVFDFRGHQVRTEIVRGRLAFALVDVCAVLGDTNPSNVAKRVRGDDLHKVEVTDSLGRLQKTYFVSEQGLIRVLQTSRSPLAKPFQAWADERVAQLMEGKTVDASGVVGESEDALILRAITTLQDRVARQAAELETARPKAEIYDKVLTPEHTFGFRDLCKTLREHFPINEADVRRLLKQKKILTCSDRLDVYSHAVDRGWAVRRPQGTWGGKERFSPRFTTKTLHWLLEELAPLEEAA